VRYLMVVAAILACLYVAGCEKIDKTSGTLEKAKSLKTNMQKTVDKVKEGMADRTEEWARKAGIGSDKSVDSEEEGDDKE
jgi:outer membrane murein-binding lipoprotein Lpp